MARPVTLLGVVATLAVTGSAAVVLAARPTAPTPTTADPEDRWQVLASSYGALDVPPTSQGWSVPDPDGVLFYADQRGRRVVGVTGPAVLDDGYCSDGRADEPSNRAFVGILPPLPVADLPAADRRHAAAWASGIGGAPLPARRTTVRLAAGAPAVVSHTTIRLRDRDRCTPARVGLHLLSTQAPTGVVSAVLVRDLGPGAVPNGVVRRILTSLRPG